MNRKRMGQFSIVAIAACAMLVRVGMASAAINITTVSVGNPGNAADGNGYGAVDYKYNIGKYDVTASQYATFLNAVAKTDTNTLYNPFMVRTDYGSGITQNGSDGNYTYSVNAAFVNRPVNNVSYWSAARFSNWLENGQPNGVQGAGTTETGTYTLTTASIANNTVSRNAGSTWSLPSEDEWYKAAYYKGGNIFADYWLYATQSDTTPAVACLIHRATTPIFTMVPERIRSTAAISPRLWVNSQTHPVPTALSIRMATSSSGTNPSSTADHAACAVDRSTTAAA